MLKQRLAAARIERILKRFARPDTPELAHFVSGVNEPPTALVDDGAHYDPQERTTPAWVQKDLTGWI
jgi:hypothetical protein